MGKEMAEPLDEHIPVLAQTLLEQISLPADAVMVDCTVDMADTVYYSERL